MIRLFFTEIRTFACVSDPPGPSKNHIFVATVQVIAVSWSFAWFFDWKVGILRTSQSPLTRFAFLITSDVSSAGLNLFFKHIFNLCHRPLWTYANDDEFSRCARDCRSSLCGSSTSAMFICIWLWRIVRNWVKRQQKKQVISHPFAAPVFVLQAVGSHLPRGVQPE